MDSTEYDEFVLDLFEVLERIAMALENLSTGLDEALTHFGVESSSRGLELNTNEEEDALKVLDNPLSTPAQKTNARILLGMSEEEAMKMEEAEG